MVTFSDLAKQFVVVGEGREWRALGAVENMKPWF